jgi:hypothetical protein
MTLSCVTTLACLLALDLSTTAAVVETASRESATAILGGAGMTAALKSVSLPLAAVEYAASP